MSTTRGKITRTNILAMLPREVVANLPHPCAPDRARRLTEELLKVVDIPQGKYVLRAHCDYYPYFFYVALVNEPRGRPRKGRDGCYKQFGVRKTTRS
jgi:hypothetical protein